MEFSFKSVADLHEFLASIASAIKVMNPRWRPIYCLRGNNQRVFMDIQFNGYPLARCDLVDYTIDATDGELGWFDLERLVELLSLLRKESSVRFTPHGSDLRVIVENNQTTFRRIGWESVNYWPEPDGKTSLDVNAGDFITLARFVRAWKEDKDEIKVKLLGSSDEKNVKVYGFSQTGIVHAVLVGTGVGAIDLPFRAVIAAGKLAKFANSIYIKQTVLNGVCIVDVPPHRFFLPAAFVHESILARIYRYIAQVAALPSCVCDSRAFAAAAEALDGEGMITLAVADNQLALERHDEARYAHATVTCGNVGPTAKIQLDCGMLARFARAFGATTSDLHIKFGHSYGFLCMQNGSGTISVIIAAFRA